MTYFFLKNLIFSFLLAFFSFPRPEPEILARMNNLVSLDLGHTNIDDITPSSLSSLPLSLREIDFTGTPLSKKLDWSGRRYSHETLENAVVNISHFLGSNLQSLNFSLNDWRGLPTNFFNLFPQLKRLDVGRNPSFAGGRSDLSWNPFIQLEYLDLSFTGMTASDVSILSLDCNVIDWFRKIVKIKDGGIHLAGNPLINGFFYSASYDHECKCLNRMKTHPSFGYTMLNRTECPGGWAQKKNLEEGVWNFLLQLDFITFSYRPQVPVLLPSDASSFFSTPSFKDRGMTIVSLLSSLNPCTWSLDIVMLSTQELPKSAPSLFARLPRLRKLTLKNINGTLPNEFVGARHVQLRHLEIMGHYGGPSQGWISPIGDLPLSLGELSNLEFFKVEHSTELMKKYFHLDEILIKLKKLNYLSLSDNGITIFPSSLVNLTELTVLRLDQNKIVGVIPAGLVGLTKLTLLWLHDNELTGVVPDWMINIDKCNICENSGLTYPSKGCQW